MPTLVRDPPPVEFRALLERRRRLGQDRFDEVWDGVLHMNPAPHSAHGKIDNRLRAILTPLADRAGLQMSGPFNLGGPGDCRVPDSALLRPGREAVYLPTAALVVEIISPEDETRQKLDFYAAHRVQELLVVDPQKRSVDWLALGPEGYGPIERSGLIDCGPAALGARIDWPPVHTG
jgi:Uma2 family endonuclease